MILLSLACADRGDTGSADACLEGGTICTFAGTGTAGLGDEGVDPLDSHLYLPLDLGFGPDGQPYLLDWNNHRIRMIDGEGLIETVAGTGMLGDGPEGPALEAAFNHPTNVAFDGAGRMVIAAWHNSRVEQLDLVSGELSFLCGTGERGYNGSGIDAREAILDLPSAVAIDLDGRVWISDQANQQIRMVEDEVIYDVGGSQRVAGYAGDGGPADEALFHAAQGQAADPANRMTIQDQVLYIADTGNHLVRTLDVESLVVDTIAGTPPDCDETGTTCTTASGYAGDGGAATEALLYGPTDVAVAEDGAVYVADTSNHCVRVVRDGVIETFAGVCGTSGYDGDQGAATDALLHKPYGVAVGPDGLVYVADTYNHVFRTVAP